ncbi:MAG TPA: hypothetical protein VFZ78_03425 [Flavisolibacter sp.]
MIEQTELVVDEWIYNPADFQPGASPVDSHLELEVMRKSAPTKKGLACRFTCRFVSGGHTLLLYVAQDSYVIDLTDRIDRDEVQRMIKNTYDKFREKYDFRKLGTVLNDVPMKEFDEKSMDVHDIVHMLN